MTSDCATPRARLLDAARRKGFPAPGPLAAAALLHAALLALLLPWPPASPRAETQRVVPVSLVLATPHQREEPPPPPEPPAPAANATTPAPAAEASAAGERTALAERDGLPQLAEAPPSAAPEPKAQPSEPRKTEPAPKPKPRQAKRPAKPSRQGQAAVPGAGTPGAAVYGVVLAAAGVVADVTLLQSSGRPDFDAAGEQMVRRSLQFAAPQQSGGATRYFTVTLRFTPELH